MQNFCFRVVIFFVLRKVGFRLVQACDFPIVWKILILLVFWCRITNYFLVDLVLLSFKNSLTCVWLHRFSLLISFDFCSYPFIGNSRETSLYYYWKVTDCLAGYFAIISLIHLLILESFNLFAGVFCKSFSALLLYMDICKPFCRGISRKFLYFFFSNIENLIPSQKKA